MREIRNAYRILAGKPKGKNHLPVYRHRWVDINMGLKRHIWRCGLDSYGSGQGPMASSRKCSNDKTLQVS
jgi:hypothetical protein